MVSLSGDIDDRTVFTQPRTLIDQDDNRQPVTDKKSSKLRPADPPIVEVKASKRPAIVVTNNPNPDTKAKSNQNEKKQSDKADTKDTSKTKDKDMDKAKTADKSKVVDKNKDADKAKDAASKPEDPKSSEKPGDKEGTKQEGKDNKDNNNNNNNRMSRFKARPDPLFYLSGPNGDRIEYRMDEKSRKRRMYLVMHKNKKKEQVAASKPPESKTTPPDAEKDKKILELEKKVQEHETKTVELKETPELRNSVLDAEKDKKILELEKRLKEMEKKTAEVKESTKSTTDPPSGKEKEKVVSGPPVEDHKGTKKKDQQSREGGKPEEEEQTSKTEKSKEEEQLSREPHTKTTQEDVKSTSKNSKNALSVRENQLSQANGKANPATKSEAKKQDGEAQSTAQGPGKNDTEKARPDQIIDNKPASGVKSPVLTTGDLWEHNDIWNDAPSNYNLRDCSRELKSSSNSSGHAKSSSPPCATPVAAGTREEPSKVNIPERSPGSSRISQGWKSHASNKSKLSGLLEFAAGRRGILPGTVPNRPHATRSNKSKSSTEKSPEQAEKHIISDIMHRPVIVPPQWYPVPLYIPVYSGPTARATIDNPTPYGPHIHPVQQPHRQPGHAFPPRESVEPPSPQQSRASRKTLSSRSVFSARNSKSSETEGSSNMSTATLESVYNTLRNREDHDVSRRRERAEKAWTRERKAKEDWQNHDFSSQRSTSGPTKKENHFSTQGERLISPARDESDIENKYKEKRKQKGSLRNYESSRVYSQTTLSPSDSVSMKRSAAPRSLQLQLWQRSDLTSPGLDAQSSSDLPEANSDSSVVRTVYTEGSNYRAPFVETVSSDKGRIPGTAIKDDDPFSDDHTIHTARESLSDRFLMSETGASVQDRSDISEDEKHQYSKRKSRRLVFRNPSSQPYDFYPYHELISKDNPSPFKKSGTFKSATSQFKREDAQKVKYGEPAHSGPRKSSPRHTVPMEAESSAKVIPVVEQISESSKQCSKNLSETTRRTFPAVRSTSETSRRRSNPIGRFSETSSRFSSSQTYRRNVDKRHQKEHYTTISSRDSESESSLDWSHACSIRAKHGRTSSISRANSQIHRQ